MCTLTLSGCSQPNDNDYRFYPLHLANVLKTEAPPIKPHYHVPSPPEWAKHEKSQSRISLIDFVGLTGCSVQKVIGEKNSNLGKHAPSSQQLLNTLDFLQHAPRCVQQLKQKQRDDSAAQLQQAIGQKQTELRLLIGNATLASSEFQGAWLNPSPDHYPQNLASDVPQALHYILEQSKQWLAGDYFYDSKRFEQALYTIKHGDLGAVYREIQATDWALTASNTIIKQRLGNQPLCYQQQSNTRFSYFNNVMQKDFIGVIQVNSAAAQKRYHALFEPLTALETLLASFESNAYRQWREARDATLTKGLEAPKRHVNTIKQLWQQCGHSH